MNSMFVDTGSTVETSGNNEKFTSSSENLMNTSPAVQRPPLSQIPLASVVTPVITSRSFNVPDPFDIDPTLFPLSSPPLTKSVASKSKTFKYRKSFDATLNDKRSTSALQNKPDEPSISKNVPCLKPASHLSSGTFS